MNKIVCFLITIVIISCQENTQKKSGEIVNPDSAIVKKADPVPIDFLSKHPLMTLMRKTPVEIGCILESEFNYKDSVFNCSYKNYVNKGDPCKNTTAYYEGLQIPAHFFKSIDPSIKNIELDFEHGSLRMISITFEESMLKEKVRALFNLPLPNDKLPDNVMSIEYGENVFSNNKPSDPAYTRWLSLTGFDHMGAGDVDCE